MNAIDFHTHVAPQWVQENRTQLAREDPCFRALYADPRARLATLEDLLASMDEAGVTASVALNLGWADEALCRRTNDYLLEGGARWPGRILPFVTVQPACADSAARELERCIEAGARGIGELRPDIQGFSLSDADRLRPIVDLATFHHMPVLTHVSEPVGHVYPGKGSVTPEQPYYFVLAFPQTTLVCAHWGGGLPFYGLMPEVKKAMAHVYFDSAASHYLYENDVFNVVARLVGAEHMLLGSDFPLIRQQRAIDEVRHAGLSDWDQEAILHGNAQRLLSPGGSNGASQ